MKWIVMSNQPFTEAQQKEFVEMIHLLNPVAELISDKTVKRDLMAKYLEKVEEIKLLISQAPGKFSFTVDGWTSKNVHPFMAIRAHWISKEWEHKSILLDLSYIDGDHSGLHYSKIFMACLERFNIPLSKVMCITMDNVGSNDTFIESLEALGIKVEVTFNSANNRVRCMAHILNLCVQDILTILKVPLNHQDSEKDCVDLPEPDLDVTYGNDAEEDVVESNQCSNQPTIVKLRTLVRKIRKSTQMRQKLKKLCFLCLMDYLTPILDVATRWNSTYAMIQRAAKLKTPLRALCSSEKALQPFLFIETEYDELHTLESLLQKFDRATNLMSMARHSTIASYLPTLNWLLDALKDFKSENPGALAIATDSGLSKLQKYEKELKVKNSNLPYIATFLNPALKMNYFKEHDYTKPEIKEIQKVICERFESDYQSGPKCDGNELPKEEPLDEFYVHMFKKAKVNREPKEFQKYMQYPLSSSKVNTLDFWRSQQSDFPNLSIMARDVLAVQSTSVAVERDFSDGADLITPERCSLLPQTIRACMCLKNWFKNEI